MDCHTKIMISKKLPNIYEYLLTNMHNHAIIYAYKNVSPMGTISLERCVS